MIYGVLISQFARRACLEKDISSLHDLWSFHRSKLVMEQSSLIGRRRSKVNVDFAPPPSDSDGGRIAP